MLAGPELAWLSKEFEADIVEESANDLHHEEGRTFQKNFKKQTSAKISSIKSLGNPFLEVGSQLLNIDSRDVLPDEDVGVKQFAQSRTFSSSSMMPTCTLCLRHTVKH